MDISIIVIQAITMIASAFAGAYIYRKGIQGDSPVPEPKKKIQHSSPKPSWDEI